ncbi:MAG: DUF3179 domain-containing protein [Chloroflexi bacterium]|nr:DUF3179 domain-containing protein [Chloroflexota bacterium]
MYSARIDGEPTTFGTSGLLYRSNKLMYDRKTNTLWSSLLGVPVIGKLAQQDLKLEFFPVELTMWSEWLDEHPGTTVLSLETGYYSPKMYEPETDSESIYYDYRVSAETMFPVWNRDDRLDTKDEVLGFSSDDSHKAYPVAIMRELRVVNDRVGEQDIVIISSANSSSIRIYEGGDYVFNLPLASDDGDGFPAILVDQNGYEWTVTEDALETETAEMPGLRRLPSHLSFWFGWFAFHPDTDLFENE